MKPAFAVPPRIISLPAALHSNSVKARRLPKSTQSLKSQGYLAFFCPARIISPGSITHLPTHPIIPRPPHPTDRVLSLAVSCLCWLVHCTRRSNPFILCAPSILGQDCRLCVCVCLFSSSLPRPSPHQNTYSHSHFSLSFTSHHRPLPHLTSNLAFYLLSFRCYSYPLVASLFALAFSLPKFDIGLIPPFAPKRDFGSSGSLGIPLRIAVADIFSNFIHRRHLLALFSCSFRTRLDWGSGK
jgi:hypothetical protein